jgi:hypothetical protein
MICMHLLTRVGFGLIGHVPNTLYNMQNIAEAHLSISIASVRSIGTGR